MLVMIFLFFEKKVIIFAHLNNIAYFCRQIQKRKAMDTQEVKYPPQIPRPLHARRPPADENRHVVLDCRTQRDRVAGGINSFSHIYDILDTLK